MHRGAGRAGRDNNRKWRGGSDGRGGVDLLFCLVLGVYCALGGCCVEKEMGVGTASGASVPRCNFYAGVRCQKIGGEAEFVAAFRCVHWLQYGSLGSSLAGI